MNLLYKSSLGEHRKLTDEGYMICVDVPIARIGEIEYNSNELSALTPDMYGKITVIRDECSLFDQEVMDSFNGKPFVVNHPSSLENSGLVDSNNWKNHSAGVIQNVRRGMGVYSNYLIADILVNDSQAINMINTGIRELSIGYTADFEVTRPGIAMQRNTIGNHVALVRRGRAGPMCAIGDSLNEELGGLDDMTEENKGIIRSALDTLRKIICGDQDPFLQPDESGSKSMEDEKDPKEGKSTPPEHKEEDPEKADGADPNDSKPGEVEPGAEESQVKDRVGEQVVEVLTNMLKEFGRRIEKLESELTAIKSPNTQLGTAGDPDLNTEDNTPEDNKSSEDTLPNDKDEKNDTPPDGVGNPEKDKSKEGDNGEEDKKDSDQDPNKDKGTDEGDNDKPKKSAKDTAADSVSIQDEKSLDELKEKVSSTLGSGYISSVQQDSSPLDSQICESKRAILGDILKKDISCSRIVRALIGHDTQVGSLTPEEVNSSFRVVLESSRQTANDSKLLNNLQFASPSLLSKDPEKKTELMTGADLNKIYQKHWNNN